MKRPDEPLEDKSDMMFGDDSPKVTVWIVAIMAALAIVGAATMYFASLPLGEYAIKEMTER